MSRKSKSGVGLCFLAFLWLYSMNVHAQFASLVSSWKLPGGELEEVQSSATTGCTALVANHNSIAGVSQYAFSSAPASSPTECTAFSHSCKATPQTIPATLVWDDG